MSYLEASRELATDRRGGRQEQAETEDGQDADASARTGGLGRGLGVADPDRPEPARRTRRRVHGADRRRRSARVAAPGGRRRARRVHGRSAAAATHRSRRRRLPRDPAGQISPNPRQPRQVFDEEALAELVHSIREFGLLQPIVVRRTSADRPLRAGHGRAPLAGRPGGRPRRPSRRSSGRPTTTTCCATPCWRTSTGRS